ncbi:hypothetical protein JCM8547_002216 [Rhodosporidiobolus lusitaniae]
MFCVSKCCIGSGLANALMTMQILLHEISHPRHRAICAAAFDQNWTLGHVLSAWISFGTSTINNSWSWRIPYLIQAIFAVYIIIATQFVPESPRWLAAQGRLAEAKQWHIDYHGNGNPDDALVNLEWEDLNAAIFAEKEAKQEKWSILLNSPANRYRLWLGTVIFRSVGISGSATLTGIGAAS